MSLEHNEELLIYLYGFLNLAKYNINDIENIYESSLNLITNKKVNISFEGNKNDWINILSRSIKIVPNILSNASSNIKNDNNLFPRSIFLRGVFDLNGYILKDETLNINCVFQLTEVQLSYLSNLTYTSLFDEDKKLFNINIKGCNMLEFLHLIYYESKMYNTELYEIYNCLLYSEKIVDNNTKFKYYKTEENAVAPSKNSVTDSGYDLHIISKISQKNNLYMYDTGIIVEPPINIYFDLVPRSSIIKKGYILANSIGIIDQTYRGSIKVALIKIDPDADELVLPLKLAQLIPRKVIHLDTEEVLNLTDLISTARGIGGYGSTDKKIT